MHFVKEIIGIISILVFIILIEIITNTVTNNSVKIIEDKIKIVSEQEDYEKIKDSIYDLSKSWEKEEVKLTCYMEHDELEEISKCVNALVFESKDGTKKNIDEELDKMKFKMNHIKDKQKVKIKNIF